MFQLFKFHTYTDNYQKSYQDSYQPEIINQNIIELSIGFFQVIPKDFLVEGLNNDAKPYYYLSFHNTLQFIEENGKIYFQKFRFSLSGTETDNHSGFNNVPLKENFLDFVEKNYLNFLTNLPIKKSFICNNKQYKINSKDYQTILEGVSLFKEIFPNERDFIVIEKINADFYKKADSGLQEGIEIYQKYTLWKNKNILENKLYSSPKATKKHKI